MTTTAPDHLASARHANQGRRSPVRSGIVVGTAAVAALAWAVITIGFDATIHGPTFADATPEPVGIGAVAMATLAAGLIGWVLLAAIERWTKAPTRIWTPTVVVAALVSLGGPLSGSGVTVGDRLALISAHLLVAAIYIPLIRHTATDETGVQP